MNKLLKIVGLIIIYNVVGIAIYVVGNIIKSFVDDFPGLSTIDTVAVLTLSALLGRKILKLSWKTIVITLTILVILTIVPALLFTVFLMHQL